MQSVSLSNDPVTIIFAGVYLLVFLAGLRSFVLGFKGRKIDDHPLCGKCRFDLTGLPKDQEKCPECGVILLRGGMIIGNLKRQPKRIWIGLIMMLVVFTLCLPTALRLTGQMNWLDKAPTWYLRMQINNDTELADDAWQLMLDRFTKKKLLTSQVRSVIKDALDLQADLKRTWHPKAGDFLQLAQTRAILTEEQWNKYVSKIADTAFLCEIRQTVQHGQPFAWRHVDQSSRMGNNTMWCRKKHLRIQIADLVLYDRRHAGGGSISANGGGYSSHHHKLDSRVWEQLQPGDYTVQLIYDYALTPYNPYNASQGSDTSQRVSRQIKYALPWTILPKGTSTVTPILDESKLEEVTAAVQVKNIVYRTKPGDCDVNLHFDKMSVPLAYDVIIRFNNQEHRVGGIHLAANRSTSWGLGLGWKVDIKDGQIVDVLLKPSVNVARQTVDLTAYWDVPLIIENVPVTVK